MPDIYDFTARTAEGRDVNLAEYRGQVVLIVNTASKCGFTPQYEGLQSLYKDYADRGLTVLAFPCDQFMHQEPGNDAEIQNFCSTKYDVTFPVFSKIEVNGPKTHPLWAFLKAQKSGLMGGGIKWNFTKFLVDRDGHVVERFPPTTAPSGLKFQVENCSAPPDPTGMRPVLTVDSDAVAANWRSLSDIHGGPAAAVVKADGYGLGACVVAPRLLAAGACHFFVAQLEEAVILRPLLPGAMIAVLNGFDAAHGPEYLAHDLLPVLGALPEIAAYQALARAQGRPLAALLHVDTGMNRLGLPAADLGRLAAEPGLHAGIAWRYLMTHLVSAENFADPVNAVQRRRFQAAAAAWPALPRSLANSSGIFLGPAFRSELARPGAALYGINPTPGRPNPMRPTLRLAAPVLQLRDIAAGEGVGYNADWIAARPTRVATVALGYADGYHRAAGNRAEAAFDGGRLPLIGRVSMDLLTFDATDAPLLAPGDMLELIGPAVPPDEVAAWAGTNGYEVLTSLAHRFARVAGPL